MPNLEPFAVIGGDSRMDHLAKALSKTRPVVRWRCSQPVSALEEAMLLAVHLILPMPVTKDAVHLTGGEDEAASLERFRSLLRPRHRTLSGGQLPSWLEERCRTYAIRCIDWMELPQVALPNAVLTAEGAIAEAVAHGERSLSHSHCAVLGYGRCGQALAHRLRYLSENVTVAARDPLQRLNAQTIGIHAIPLSALTEKERRFDLLFNTIPAMALPREALACLGPGAVVIDLASGPLSSHISSEILADPRVKAISCPGLPGKYFPRDAGEILAEATLAQLAEMGSHI